MGLWTLTIVAMEMPRYQNHSQLEDQYITHYNTNPNLEEWSLNGTNRLQDCFAAVVFVNVFVVINETVNLILKKNSMVLQEWLIVSIYYMLLCNCNCLNICTLTQPATQTD